MNTSSIRKPVCAGMFYPDDGAELHDWVQRFLMEGHAAVAAPKAVIAPHAGFLYSGAIAGSAFAAWRALRGKIKRVVIAGPSHRVGFQGIALSDAELFATPLGLIPVDVDAADALRSLPHVIDMEAAHTHEHSIETHLPFLQEALGEFKLVPLIVGETSPREVALAFSPFWNDPDTIFSISSDLSHYHRYEQAVRLDAATTRAIVGNNPHDISPSSACGRLSILGLLHIAGRHTLSATALDVRNSGDTAGDRSRVVGYGAYAFS